VFVSSGTTVSNSKLEELPPGPHRELDCPTSWTDYVCRAVVWDSIVSTHRDGFWSHGANVKLSFRSLPVDNCRYSYSHITEFTFEPSGTRWFSDTMSSFPPSPCNLSCSFCATTDPFCTVHSGRIGSLNVLWSGLILGSS
jgi:hypothetical protein